MDDPWIFVRNQWPVVDGVHPANTEARPWPTLGLAEWHIYQSTRIWFVNGSTYTI